MVRNGDEITLKKNCLFPTNLNLLHPNTDYRTRENIVDFSPADSNIPEVVTEGTNILNPKSKIF